MYYRASFLAYAICMHKNPMPKMAYAGLRFEYIYIYIEFVHKGVASLTKSHSVY